MLWKKQDEYDPTRSFKPWAFKIAYLQVLAYRKRQQPDRLIFDPILVKTIATEFPESAGGIGERVDALNKCVGQLTTRQRDMISQRYEQGRSLADISSVLNREAGTIAVALFRIRKLLADCIDRTLRGEETS